MKIYCDEEAVIKIFSFEFLWSSKGVLNRASCKIDVEEALFIPWHQFCMKLKFKLPSNIMKIQMQRF